MNITDFTARKLAKADQAAADTRLTHLAFRLLWLILSAADRRTGVVRGHRQVDFAKVLDCTTRAIQTNRDLLVACGYIDPIRKTGRGHILAYDVSKNANLGSHSKGELAFASEREKANGGEERGEPTCQEGELSFGQNPLASLDVPLAPSRETVPGGPRRANDALGPLNTDALRRRIGKDNYEAWLTKVSAVALAADGTLTITVPTKFVALQIFNRFERAILESSPGARRITMEIARLPDFYKATTGPGNIAGQ